MARNARIQVLRTTRANLDAQASASGLYEGEPYLITDEGRLAVGTGVDDYVECQPALTAASQAEMEAGTETALRSMSPLRVAQAIEALGGSGASVPISTADFLVAENTSVIAVDTLDVSGTLTVAGNLGVI